MLDKNQQIAFRRDLASTCDEIGYIYHESWKKKTITLSSPMKYLPTLRLHLEYGGYRVKRYIDGKRVKQNPRGARRKKRRKSTFTLNNQRKLIAFLSLLRLWVEMRPARHDEDD